MARDSAVVAGRGNRLLVSAALGAVCVIGGLLLLGAMISSERSLREEIRRLRAMCGEQQSRLAALEGQPRDEAARVTDGLWSRSTCEYGTVALSFGEGRNKANVDLAFKNSYASPPVVLVADNREAGQFIFVKARRITVTGCNINAEKYGDWNKAYEASIGYLVVGERAQ